ncbi:nitrate- and nitrite sensing domain-containing protein [Rhizobium sp. PAMB 3174]
MRQTNRGYARHIGWAAALPLTICLLSLPQAFRLSESANYAQMNLAADLRTTAFADMTQQLQAERFRALRFGLNPSLKNNAALAEARLRTDDALDRFDEAMSRVTASGVSDVLADQIDELMLKFSSLARQRRQIDRHKLPWRESFAAYSALVTAVLDLSQSLHLDKVTLSGSTRAQWFDLTFWTGKDSNDLGKEVGPDSFDVNGELSHLQSNVLGRLSEISASLDAADIHETDITPQKLRIIKLQLGILADLENRILSETTDEPDKSVVRSLMCRSSMCNLLSTDVL